MKRIIEISKPARTEKDLRHQETLFHNANGYIGVRGTPEEGYPAGMDSMRGMYVNGVYDITDMKQAENLCNFVNEKETMLNCADTQTLYLSADGETFSMFEGEVSGYSRVLNMDEGYTARSLVWTSPAGKQMKISIKRMTSFVQLSLFTVEYTVTPLNFDGELVITSLQTGNVKNYCNPKDPRMAADSPQFLNKGVCLREGDLTYASGVTGRSHISVGTAVGHKIPQNARLRITEKDGGWTNTCLIRMPAQRGEKLTVIKYTVFADSVRRADPCAAAMDDLKAAMAKDISW